VATFNSYRDYWAFQDAVKHRTRYVRDEGSEVFLNVVLITAQARAQTLPVGTLFWRAQPGCDLDENGEPVPYKPERMKPLKDSATEGRANPKGIPCLYVATCKETALAEVRPWKESLISIGQFKLQRPLRVVNCTLHADDSNVIYLEEPSAGEREQRVWSDIDRAFATPVARSDDRADYAPSQIISDLFKANGFDGVGYMSSLGTGHNIALFDLNCAELVNCRVSQTTTIDFKFKEVGKPYSM